MSRIPLSALLRAFLWLENFIQIFSRTFFWSSVDRSPSLRLRAIDRRHSSDLVWLGDPFQLFQKTLAHYGQKTFSCFSMAKIPLATLWVEYLLQFFYKIYLFQAFYRSKTLFTSSMKEYLLQASIARRSSISHMWLNDFFQLFLDEKTESLQDFYDQKSYSIPSISRGPSRAIPQRDFLQE